MILLLRSSSFRRLEEIRKKAEWMRYESNGRGQEGGKDRDRQRERHGETRRQRDRERQSDRDKDKERSVDRRRFDSEQPKQRTENFHRRHGNWPQTTEWRSYINSQIGLQRFC